MYKTSTLRIQIRDFVPGSPYWILPCSAVDTEALQPVFNENMLDGGTRSLWELQCPLAPTGIPTTPYPRASAPVLGLLHLGSGPKPLPAPFPEELEPGLSPCSGSASISVNSPGKKNRKPEIPVAKTLPTP